MGDLQEIVVRVQRAQRWGVEYEPEQAVMMDMDLFEERHEASHDLERRAETVYM